MAGHATTNPHPGAPRWLLESTPARSMDKGKKVPTPRDFFGFFLGNKAKAGTEPASAYGIISSTTATAADPPLFPLFPPLRRFALEIHGRSTLPLLLLPPSVQPRESQGYKQALLAAPVATDQSLISKKAARRQP